MQNLETLSASLASRGFHVALHRRRGEWHCFLYSNDINGLPTGSGTTALDAVVAADADRQRLIAEGR